MTSANTAEDITLKMPAVLLAGQAVNSPRTFDVYISEDEGKDRKPRLTFARGAAGADLRRVCNHPDGGCKVDAHGLTKFALKPARTRCEVSCDDGVLQSLERKAESVRHSGLRQRQKFAATQCQKTVQTLLGLGAVEIAGKWLSIVLSDQMERRCMGCWTPWITTGFAPAEVRI